jgi:hypothetical protein
MGGLVLEVTVGDEGACDAGIDGATAPGALRPWPRQLASLEVTGT